jgi:hypothetical protein
MIAKKKSSDSFRGKTRADRFFYSTGHFYLALTGWDGGLDHPNRPVFGINPGNEKQRTIPLETNQGAL